jgi:hypothetical protein
MAARKSVAATQVSRARASTGRYWQPHHHSFAVAIAFMAKPLAANRAAGKRIPLS